MLMKYIYTNRKVTIFERCVVWMLCVIARSEYDAYIAIITYYMIILLLEVP